MKNLNEYSLEEVRDNFTFYKLNARDANLYLISAGVMVALRYNNDKDSKQALQQLFDTKNSNEADFRNAALRLIKHHGDDLTALSNSEATLKAVTVTLVEYIKTFCKDGGAIWGDVNSKRRCLPKLPLLDERKERIEKEMHDEKKQEEKQAELNDDTPITLVLDKPSPDGVYHSPDVTAKGLDTLLRHIAKFLATDVDPSHTLQHDLVLQLGILTGKYDVPDTEISASIQQARHDFEKWERRILPEYEVKEAA